MRVTCFGSRGSLPSPSRKGFSTMVFGGNTNCFFVEAGPFQVIVGMGSGAAVLGDDLMRRWREGGRSAQHFIVLLTHYHWDHIQGLPFCTPVYIGSNTFRFHGMKPSGHEGDEATHPRTVVEMMLAHQQLNPHFPVAHESLPAKKVYRSHDRQFSEAFYYMDHGRFEGEDQKEPSLTENPYKNTVGPNGPCINVLGITTIPLNHPDGCLGWRLDYMGKSVAFCYDHEPLRFSNHKINTIAKDVDLIVLDGSYTEEQLQGMQQGFGHGSPQSCVDQARDCGAKRLLVHHHDPKADDMKLREMLAEATEYAADAGYDGSVDFAREGETYEV